MSACYTLNWNITSHILLRITIKHSLKSNLNTTGIKGLFKKKSNDKIQTICYIKRANM